MSREARGIDTAGYTSAQAQLQSLRASLAQVRDTNLSLLEQVEKLKKGKTAEQERHRHLVVVAQKMRSKLIELKRDLIDEKHKSKGLEAKVVSLTERLLVADMRRRDLETRFGTLARPSTSLLVRTQDLPLGIAVDKSAIVGGSGRHLSDPPFLLKIDPNHMHENMLEPNPLPVKRPSQRGLHYQAGPPLVRRVGPSREAQKFLSTRQLKPWVNLSEYDLLGKSS